MSAISLILLLAAGIALVLCVTALFVARALRAEVAALRAELLSTGLPGARTAPDEELIRAAVADALADERERELAEARAFWADQEAREHGSTGSLFAGRGIGPDFGDGDEALLDALLEGYLPGALPSESPFQVPRQGVVDRAPGDCPELSEGHEPAERAAENDGTESAELAAARRRHPSHPGYTLAGEPVDHEHTDRPDPAEREDAEHAAGAGNPVAESGRESRAAEQRRTTEQLRRLAETRIPLADVRPGPLGTLDVFLFADGTTLCLSPGHQETAQRLVAALRAGRRPVLLGGSGVSGAYALTFGCGPAGPDGAPGTGEPAVEENVYLLADRVVTA
ncbi:hypothetical protein GCM10027160_28530 [Streptomyces calidiresistens]|uniref:Secreted protein n=1 Tax=Streptomyces calidiresistens TaxID=1485586 RepID=A0A7W3T6E2_9ACTN|nr:hypothetical protein [Streptomyces calidiresistens]MBB0231783.1 hypothetical protein [Streptomyces calidiresistens]